MRTILLSVLLASTTAFAGKKVESAPTKTSDRDATRCENIEMKVNNLDESANRIATARKALIEEYIKIYAGYGLDPNKKDHIAPDGTITKAPTEAPKK